MSKVYAVFSKGQDSISDEPRLYEVFSTPEKAQEYVGYCQSIGMSVNKKFSEIEIDTFQFPKTVCVMFCSSIQEWFMPSEEYEDDFDDEGNYYVNVPYQNGYESMINEAKWIYEERKKK
jgi:hypothetical protein